MAGKPAEPPAAGQSETGRRREGVEERPHVERWGPLVITRTVKADGRALVLYAHDEREPT
jgi:hypothetical protein